MRQKLETFIVVTQLGTGELQLKVDIRGIRKKSLRLFQSNLSVCPSSKHALAEEEKHSIEILLI